MFRFEGPAARRLRRQATQRARWEIALLLLAVGHWAYHKNREWDLLVKDLVASRAGEYDFDDLDDGGPSTTAPPDAIDLTSTDDVLRAPAAR
jgi:hypothetical protein